MTWFLVVVAVLLLLTHWSEYLAPAAFFLLAVLCVTAITRISTRGGASNE